MINPAGLTAGEVIASLRKVHPQIAIGLIGLTATASVIHNGYLHTVSASNANVAEAIRDAVRKLYAELLAA